MRKLLSLLLVLLVLCPCALAESMQSGAYTYVVLEDGSAAITGFDPTLDDSARLVIPDKLDGHPVVQIGASAFSGCVALTQVVLPEDMAYIGDGAFLGCTGLTSVSFGAEVKEPGFFSSLVDNVLTVPLPTTLGGVGDYAMGLLDSVTYTIETKDIDLPDEEFNALLDSIVSVPLPGSLDEVGGYAVSLFDGVVNTFKPGELIIGRLAFSHCAALTSIVLPEKLTTMGSGAFLGCSALSAATLGEKVAYIGESAFSDCAEGLTLTVTPGSYAETYAKDVGFAYVHPAK